MGSSDANNNNGNNSNNKYSGDAECLLLSRHFSANVGLQVFPIKRIGFGLNYQHNGATVQ